MEVLEDVCGFGVECVGLLDWFVGFVGELED